MVKITDAERAREVDIPDELARISGVFKDISDSDAVPGADPVSSPVASHLNGRSFLTSRQKYSICLSLGCFTVPISRLQKVSQYISSLIERQCRKIDRIGPQIGNSQAR